MRPLHFAPFAFYAVSLAFADLLLLLVVMVYSYCFRWRGRARFGDDVERPRQPVEAAALPVAVVTYRGDAREFNNDECVICLASFEEGEECWAIKTCNHGYHESCIKEWLSRDGHCPLCRGLVRAGWIAGVTSPPIRSSSNLVINDR